MRDTKSGAASPLRSDTATPTAPIGPDHTAHLQPTVPGHRGSALWEGDSRLDVSIPAPFIAEQAAGPLPGGRQRASGSGGADGSHVRTFGGRDADGAPRFDQPVAPGGYLWWYVDALSDDGRHGLSIIAFVGSVFSPYYAWARSRNGGVADPENFCAINVALYGAAGKRWTMTERGRSSVRRSAASLK